jgi:hypothetical protein
MIWKGRTPGSTASETRSKGRAAVAGGVGVVGEAEVERGSYSRGRRRDRMGAALLSRAEPEPARSVPAFFDQSIPDIVVLVAGGGAAGSWEEERW